MIVQEVARSLFLPHPHAIFPPLAPHPSPSGGVVELPTSHRVPLRWLLEHGGESIRYRTLKEIAPPHVVTDEDLAAQLLALPGTKGVQAVAKKQKDSGIWGANLLATAPSPKDGIKEPGTVP